MRTAVALAPAIVALIGGCSGASKAPGRAVAKAPVRPIRPVTPKGVAPKLPELPAVLMGRKASASRSLPAADDGLPTDAELKGAWARVFLRSNPGPYQYVAYEITARGKAGVMSHLRGTMGRKDPMIRTELIEQDKLRRTMARLRDLGAATMVDPGSLVPPEPDKAGKPGKKRRRKAKAAPAGELDSSADADEQPRWPAHSEVPVYELSFRLGGKEKTVVVADPYASDDHRYATFINAVRRSVIGTVGDLGWHAGTGTDAKAGYLFVDSVPGATVTVDGVKLPEKTPVFAYALSPGKHEVVLENEAQGLKRTYKVRIRRGLTTSLEVDLR